MENGGCWIFLSHSSNDIQKVRIVRNEFELWGHNPLAFHLKCLNDNTPEGKREIDELIRREIDAREWFVFCDSPAAAASPYVSDEHNYILSAGKEKVWTIDMTENVQSIKYKIQKICSAIEVFVSYAHRDSAVAHLLMNCLAEKDYAVWDPRSELKLSSAPFRSQIEGAIDRCSKKGFYVILITENSIVSDWIFNELDYASTCDATIIPILVGNIHLPSSLSFRLSHLHRLSVPEMPTKEDFQNVVKTIDTYMLEKISLFNKGE